MGRSDFHSLWASSGFRLMQGANLVKHGGIIINLAYLDQSCTVLADVLDKLVVSCPILELQTVMKCFSKPITK